MQQSPYAREVIWIIGASSGIGRALAIQLDNLGATIILSARTTEALHKLAARLKNQAHIEPFDIADNNAVLRAFDHVKKHYVINRIIVMAARYQPECIQNMDVAFASQLIDVNLKGTIYVTQAALRLMSAQAHGQIAVCGSIAGYIGLPAGQPYSASKAAVINYMQSLYNEAPGYLSIKLISPGFVATPLTDKNTFKMPFIISAEAAAEHIIKGLKSAGFEIHFPKRMTWIFKLLQKLHYRLLLPLVKKLAK